MLRHLLTILFMLATAGASALDKTDAIKIMCIGDSITHGVNAQNYGEGMGGYRGRLAALLTADGWTNFTTVGTRNDYAWNVFPAHHRNHEGLSSDTIQMIYNRISGYAAVATYTPDVALVLAGTNDILNLTYPNFDNSTRIQSENRYKTLIRHINDNSPGVIILAAQIPPVHASVGAINNPEIEIYNADLAGWISDLAGEGIDIHLVDCWTGVSVGHSNQNDWIHPNSAGYDTMAARWLAKLNDLTSPAETTPPSVPNGLASSNISWNSFDLSWNASTDDTGVASYDVYVNGAFARNSTSTSTTITGLTGDTGYTVTVIAKDVYGNVSNASSGLLVTTTAPPEGPYVDKDSAVTIMCIGDSITVGNNGDSGVWEGDAGYRDYLHDQLTANGWNNLNFVGSQNGNSWLADDQEHEGYDWNLLSGVLSNVTSSNSIATMQPTVALVAAGNAEIINSMYPNPIDAPFGTNNPDNDAIGNYQALIEKIHSDSPATVILIGKLPPVTGGGSGNDPAPIGGSADEKWFNYYYHEWKSDLVNQFNAELTTMVEGLAVGGIPVMMVDTNSGVTTGTGEQFPSLAGYETIASAWFGTLEALAAGGPSTGNRAITITITDAGGNVAVTVSHVGSGTELTYNAGTGEHSIDSLDASADQELSITTVAAADG